MGNNDKFFNLNFFFQIDFLPLDICILIQYNIVLIQVYNVYIYILNIIYWKSQAQSKNGSKSQFFDKVGTFLYTNINYGLDCILKLKKEIYIIIGRVAEN